MAETYDIRADYIESMKAKVGGKTIQNNFRASSFGHPCARKHYYDRTEYKDPYPWYVLARFAEGNLHEPAIEQALRDAGYTIDATQQAFRIEEDGIVLSMRIDGMLGKVKDGHRGPFYPFDSKTMNPWDWDRIQDADDFLYAKKFFYRQYPVQILCAMYKLDAPYGCLVLKNKQSGEIKDIWFSFDLHVSWLSDAFKRGKLVEECVKVKEAPERTDDLDLCINCDWRRICLPDLRTAPGVKIVEGSEEVADDIVRMEELRAQHREFVELEKRAKAPFKTLATGDYILGDWLVRCKDRTRTTYDVPEDVKKQYKKEAASRYITFLPVGGQDD